MAWKQIILEINPEVYDDSELLADLLASIRLKRLHEVKGLTGVYTGDVRVEAIDRLKDLYPDCFRLKTTR